MTQYAAPHALSGIQDKLERANENILNLEREIAAFLQDGAYPVLADQEMEVIQEAVESHSSRIIPPRFSVLAGEIIHHLRSSLDHIAWELSSAKKRTTDPKGIGFPIYLSKPSTKNESRSYERKVEGIPNPGRRIIEALQPYHRAPAMLTGPHSDPLWIIHDMDVTDKHRELVLTAVTFDITAEGMTESIWLMLYRQADFPEREIVGLGRAFDPNSKITAQISFREFGGRKAQPLVPALSKLTRYVHRVALVFADECF